MVSARKKVPAPVGICETCYYDANVTYPLPEYSGVESTVLVSYCRHHQTCGFIQMDCEEERWTMFSPVHENAWRWFIEGVICSVIEEGSMHLFDGVPNGPHRYEETLQLSKWPPFGVPH